jgi:hypothetical protein
MTKFSEPIFGLPFETSQVYFSDQPFALLKQEHDRRLKRLHTNGHCSSDANETQIGHILKTIPKSAPIKISAISTLFEILPFLFASMLFAVIFFCDVGLVLILNHQ